ncbi:MAG: bifunctional transcriptional activator/DNA repair enzyme AdaA [Sphingobacterium sp.]
MEQTQQELNYSRVASAIEYIRGNFKKRPNLEDVANHVNMSPFHFQRMFTDWAGTSPKKFLQFIQITFAKKLLKEQNLSIFDAHLEAGLGSTSRLHDLFIQIEGMSPAVFKKSGKGLAILYSFHDTPFGTCLVASTPIGICYLAFVDNPLDGIQDLKHQFSNAEILPSEIQIHREAVSILSDPYSDIGSIKLHLKGSTFQLKVWEALLQIPPGQICTYGQIAKEIGQPNASRAVGTAIGQNLVGFLIPCHRVIQSGGELGGYRWSTTRKTAILGWEYSKNVKLPHDAQ